MNDLIERLRNDSMSGSLDSMSGSLMDEAAARIEALEAALRIYADEENWYFGRRLDPNGSRFEGVKIARAALGRDAGK